MIKNHFMWRNTITMIIGFSLITLFNSCQDYDPACEEVIVKTSFERNFINTFGDIDPNQSWDLTKTMPRTKKYDVPVYNADTRATHAGEDYNPATTQQLNDLVTKPGSIDDRNGWYTVQPATLTWMNQNLVEGRNNTSKGSAFTLIPPENEFAIIPIYQGRAGLVWDLHLVDTGTGIDYKLWSKSDGIYMFKNDEWSQPDQSYDFGHTIGASSVISQPLIIDSRKLSGKQIFLYLDITSGGNDEYAHDEAAQRSDEGMMLSLNCPIPQDLDVFTQKEGSLVMIVGAEDANLYGSDWDMNDVVFLIVGYPLIPDLIEFYHKRYLCEDLGNTYDFDFNDIVVDVNQTSYLKAVLSDDHKEINRVEDLSKRIQTATISHLCGELPFVVTVGDYTFPVVSDPTDETKTLQELGPSYTRATGWEPDVTKKITGWNKDENNINIKVAKNPKDAIVLTEAFGATEVIEENAERHIYRIDFPQDGKAPLIIAVDRTIDWMDEYVHIPEEWWKEGKFYDPDEEQPIIWDYTQYPLTYETNGDAILNETGLAFEWWGQLSFNNQSSFHANLLNAVDEGYTKLNVYFENQAHGKYHIRAGNAWDDILISETQFGYTTALTIDISSITSIVQNMGGIILIIQTDWDSTHEGHATVTKITASK